MNNSRMAARLALLVLALATRSVAASNCYVDAKSGDDANDGRTAAKAFKTIQKAANQAAAGDTITVADGVYSDPVKVSAKGTREAPITLKSAAGPDHCILSGADRGVREQKTAWTLDDLTSDLAMYSIPVSGKRPPTRVLCDDKVLLSYSAMPYSSLEQLASFTLGKQKTPGPQRGWFWDPKTGRLHVRLPDHGDPNKHRLAVSPGSDDPARRSLIEIPGDGSPAFVVIDGFTFETPGALGVSVAASDVTVENCRFLGCEGGVGGTSDARLVTNAPAQRSADRVVVRNCEFSEDFGFDDYLEILQLGGSITANSQGLIVAAGRSWEVDRCHVHDTFTGLSSAGASASQDLTIHDCRFERIAGTAIEAGQHSINLRVARNVIRDCLAVFSWQPAEEPWAGPVLFSQNVAYNRPELTEFLLKFQKRPLPPALIISGAFGKTYGTNCVPDVPAPGLFFCNNTIFWEIGTLFADALQRSYPSRVELRNNILVARIKMPAGWPDSTPHLVFANNVCEDTPPFGLGDQVLRVSDHLGLKAPREGDFRPLPGSYVLGKAMPTPELGVALKDIGAIQNGDTWYPPAPRKAGGETAR